MHRFLSLGLAIVAATMFTGADWLQFRSADTTGIAQGPTPPVSWSEDENVAWKAELPGRGLSGAIVIGDRVIVTASSGFEQDRLHVLCFSDKTGEKLWERQFWATGRTQTHKKMCVATPTPASDGKHIFAFFSSNDLVCLDLAGDLMWYRALGRDFPNASNSLGMASSPILVDETLIVQVESDDDAFATGINIETGIARWKIDRPNKANWTSPALLKGGANDGGNLVLLQSSKGVSAILPRTGKQLWSYDEGASTIPSSVVRGNTVFVPSHGITALRPVPGGESAPELLWQQSSLAPSTASPFVYDSHLFTVNRAGVVACADLKTGKRLWQLRLKGPFTSSPVAAGGHLFFFNEKGLGQVVKPGAKSGTIAGEGDLGETILATPAIANGAVYVRSDGHLWKIAK
ncbi:MAG: PQQ-binding-like beta-propeller repeat protein [Planctomycetaceae bacterium]|jgi:outer membrane protein assembly factor BamB|nr:PQQ-binding-like beta-propeller repeat protein [Planctomycetaceae bacterium]MBT6494839.1 PQQ-binding-like beta-propeller repeat protein [Planctomycetaceae bacterium]